MSLVKEYASFLRREQHIHAVWPPLTSIVTVGDYGVFHEGTFHRLGNIDLDFGVDPDAQDAPSVTLDLQSKGVTFVRFQGNMEVPTFDATLSDVDAKLEVKFERKHSFFLKAKTLNAREMKSLQGVGFALKLHDGWDRSWLVVSKLYSGESVTVIATTESDTTATFNGKASVLAAFEKDWGASAGIGFGSNKSLAQKLRGQRGPVGVELFSFGFFGGIVAKKLVQPGEEKFEPVAWDKEPTDAF